MKRVAHVSDLHFGAQDKGAVDLLLDDLVRMKPDLVAISGDLTQRARPREFRAARKFLDRLPAPWIAVPGNHDVPLFDLAARFLRPLDRWRRAISADPDPFLVLDDLLVVGVNTARSLTVTNGRISREQMDRIDAILRRHGKGRFVAVLTHHPFLPRRAGGPIVGRAAQALAVLERGGADLLIAGHHHRGYAGDVREHHVELKASILVAHAGTAVSHRLRGEPNSYNLLCIARRHVAVMVRELKEGRFDAKHVNRFVKHRGRWHAESRGFEAAAAATA